MSHPLHEKRKVVEFSYVFCIVVDIDGEYWDIPLKESKDTKAFVKKRIWTIDAETLTVQLSRNNKNAIITFPDGVIRTIPLDSHRKPVLTQKYKVERINEKRVQRAKRAEFHKLLKTLGISFDINFCNYKEDADYMTVYVDGKEVYSGVTEDLKTSKGA